MNPGAPAAEPPFRLVVPPIPPDVLRVHRMRGREALSRPYRFTLEVSLPADGSFEIERALLGASAALVLTTGGAPRVVHGVLESIRHEGAREASGRVQYRVVLAPRLALLRRSRGSAVHQDASVVDVVRGVLSRHGIPLALALGREYPKRAYVTQYEESELAFVERLLAEAGIFYAFAQPAGLVGLLGSLGGGAADVAALGAALLEREAVVLGDGPESAPSIGAWGLPPAGAGVEAPPLLVRAASGLGDGRARTVTRFEPAYSVRAERAYFRGYDPDHPQLALLAEAGPSAALEIYEHHTHFLFPRLDDAKDEPTRALAAARRSAHVARGETLCADVAAGARFRLEDHPIGDANRAYAVLEVRHRGAEASTDDVYRNELVCVPLEALAAGPPPRRRRVQATLTAEVVGPEGAELHADAAGRIKIQFHWDREGSKNDRSSCWVRCMQAWGGAGWGTQFIPRVGMEVVVAFDGGDPDKPIVVGALYNGTHPMPFSPKEDGTRSGIRTRSIHDANGYNELSFKDERGAEEVRLHAQRDLIEIVGNDQRLEVQQDLRAVVRRDRELHVGGSDTTTVRGGARRVVEGDAEDRVDGALRIVGEGDADLRVGGTRTTRVGGLDVLEQGGGARIRTNGDVMHRLLGDLTVIVGEPGADGAHALHVEGSSRTSASKRVELQSEGEILLRVGSSFLRIAEDRIELVAGTVSVAGEKGSLAASGDGLLLSTDEDALLLSKKLTVKTQGASLSMGDEVKVDGSKILLNSPEQASEEAAEPEPPTRVSLVDQDGNPIPRAPYRVTLEDGTELSGVLGEDGTAELRIPSGGTIRFPELPDARKK